MAPISSIQGNKISAPFVCNTDDRSSWCTSNIVFDHKEYFRIVNLPPRTPPTTRFKSSNINRGNELALAAIILGVGFLAGGPIGLATGALLLGGCYSVEDIGGAPDEKNEGKENMVFADGKGNTETNRDAGTVSNDMTTCEELSKQTEIPNDGIDNDCDGITDADSWLQVSAGGEHACGIRTDNTVECWGTNENGATDNPTETFIQISAGGGFTCGVKMDYTVECWGFDYWNQASPPSGTFNQVSAGGPHACGLKRTDDRIVCWGRNDRGKSSDPSGTFNQVTAGVNHSCGIRPGDSVECWGLDDYDLLNVPTGDFTQIDASGGHTCGVKTNNIIACWGDNEYGECNDSPGTECTGPSGSFLQVTTGGEHTCGIKTDNTVECWGNAGSVGRTTPPSGTFIQIDAGSFHTCGIRTDNTIECWGSDTDGRSTPPLP